MTDMETDLLCAIMHRLLHVYTCNLSEITGQCVTATAVENYGKKKEITTER